ncbi:hypothetical protein HFZ78_18800 [Priestia megaterium]|uniref:Uncharacterized protein n=1 Tax=Priestia megaterium TaxID=1404 RepID=A0A6H1P4N0_PRIMG|nr:hypothetical protein [Priestia megaterium]QIZ08503.1 hypothetical protein HFZ78_18800 [Priestia megaterium]
MTTIWEKLAKEWRIRKPQIDKARLEEHLGGHLDNVQSEIDKSKSVPSAFDEIYSDDDDDDDDW